MDLFSFNYSARWPAGDKFPLNIQHEGNVKEQVLKDIQSSEEYLIITGFTSLSNIIDVFGTISWDELKKVRIVLGFEPDPRGRKMYPFDDLPKEILEYWLERGYSPFKGGRLIKVVELIKSSQIHFKILEKLHAKIYLGEQHGIIGSSNFTNFGLMLQKEANIRLENNSTEPIEQAQYNGLKQIANNFFEDARDYNQQMLELLQNLVHPVSWQEALARAVAELLLGEWIKDYPQLFAKLNSAKLWPSQRIGIAKAMIILQNQGNILIADPTGSGKTKFITALQLAMMHWQIAQGRINKTNSLVVCPKVVKENWNEERLTLQFSNNALLSMGVLSNSGPKEASKALKELNIANLLIIDEAHNYLNRKSKRSDFLALQSAEHIILSTATPINKKIDDLLRLIELLDVDNLNDDELREFQALKRDPNRSTNREYLNKLRRYIRKFTVRRTKKQLNDLIKLDPESYKNRKGDPCRYPVQVCRTYKTQESEGDKEIARKINELAEKLKGLIYLRKINKPEDYVLEKVEDQEAYIKKRLRAANALAIFMIREKLRSSKVALVEHIEGTKAATKHFDFISSKIDSGDIISTLKDHKKSKPKSYFDDHLLPGWFTDFDQYQEACEQEISLYQQISELAKSLSDEREKGKANELVNLTRIHKLVLAFDSTVITLDYLQGFLPTDKGITIYVARGGKEGVKNNLLEDFSLESEKENIIGLCSDALSEGVNLQKSPCVLFLDMPSVLRIAEQRVGRVDRMDSPHDSIFSYWPDDSPEFALKSDRRLIKTSIMAGSLIGNNLDIPSELMDKHLEIVKAENMIKEYEQYLQDDLEWEGITDAFKPLYDLVEGPKALVPAELYKQFRNIEASVRCRVSFVRSNDNWAFFAFRGIGSTAPRWYFIDAEGKFYNEFAEICEQLRKYLTKDVIDEKWETADSIFQGFLKLLKKNEREVLPNKKRRALEVAEHILKSKLKNETDLRRIELMKKVLQMFHFGEADELTIDYYRFAQMWVDILQPIVLKKRRENKRYRTVISFNTLKNDHSEVELTNEKLEEIIRQCPFIATLEHRIASCIIGISSITE